MNLSPLSRAHWAILLVGLLTITFQNCSPSGLKNGSTPSIVEISKTSTSSASSLTSQNELGLINPEVKQSSGNGTGYEGKIKFVSIDPGACSSTNRLEPKQIIEKVNGTFFRTRWDCTDIAPEPVVSSELIGSKPSPGILTSGQQTIFENNQTRRSDEFIYAICRGSYSDPSGEQTYTDGVIKIRENTPDTYHNLPYSIFGEFATDIPSKLNAGERVRRIYKYQMFVNLKPKYEHLEMSFYMHRSSLGAFEDDKSVAAFRVNLFKPDYFKNTSSGVINGRVMVPSDNVKVGEYIDTNCVRLKDFKFL